MYQAGDNSVILIVDYDRIIVSTFLFLRSSDSFFFFSSRQEMGGWSGGI